MRFLDFRQIGLMAAPATTAEGSLISLGAVAVTGVILAFCLVAVISYAKGRRGRDRYPGLRPPPPEE